MGKISYNVSYDVPRGVAFARVGVGGVGVEELVVWWACGDVCGRGTTPAGNDVNQD